MVLAFSDRVCNYDVSSRQLNNCHCWHYSKKIWPDCMPEVNHVGFSSYHDSRTWKFIILHTGTVRSTEVRNTITVYIVFSYMKTAKWGNLFLELPQQNLCLQSPRHSISDRYENWGCLQIHPWVFPLICYQILQDNTAWRLSKKEYLFIYILLGHTESLQKCY